MDRLEYIINVCTLKQQFDNHVPLGVYILHVSFVNTLFDPIDLPSFSSFSFHMLFSHVKIMVYISRCRSSFSAVIESKNTTHVTGPFMSVGPFLISVGFDTAPAFKTTASVQ